jgi:hypothetical protein
MPSEAPPKDPTTGRFVGRSETNLPIETVLANEADKRAEQEAQAKAREGNEPPKKEPKDALDDAAEQVMDDFVGVDRKRDKADADTAKSKDKEAKDKKRQQERDVKNKAKAKQAQSAPAPQLTPDQMATSIADGIARGLKPKEEKTEKREEAPKPTGPEARHIETLDRMEKLWPDEYKGAAKRYQDAQVKIDTYRKSWEKDHPGESFDEDSDEHKDYYDKNDLFEFWDSRDYARAAGSIEAERIKTKDDEEKNRKDNERLSDLERKEKLREARGQIIKEQVDTSRAYWKALGDDFEDVITDDGQVNNERLKELREADPIATNHRVAAARDLSLEVEAVYSLMNGLAKFDANNPVHAAMGTFGETMEKALASKPIGEKQDADGRTFLTMKEYYAMPKDQREAKHWTLSARDIAYHRAKVLASETEATIKQKEAELEQFATARGYSKPNQDDKNGSRENSEHEDEHEERGGKPRSPTSGSESRMAQRQFDTRNKHENSSSSFLDTI